MKEELEDNIREFGNWLSLQKSPLPLRKALDKFDELLGYKFKKG